MKLVDPTSRAPVQNLKRAPEIESLDGKVVGLLSNGKLNADLLLQETAGLFADKHGCRVNRIVYKANPSAPADKDAIDRVSASSDFVLTATGD